MHTTPPPTPEPITPAEPPSPNGPRRGRLRAIAGAGLVAGLMAVAIGGVAGAEVSGSTTIDEPADSPEAGRMIIRLADDGDNPDMSEFDAEIEAAFEAFEQCLADAGVDVAALEDPDLDDTDVADVDEEALDEAIESCEPILDEIDGLFVDEWDLSPEDEAVFEAFDQCLIESGLDIESLDEAEEFEMTESQEEAIDAAFDSCESILDDLSDDAIVLFDEVGCDDDEHGDDRDDEEFDGDDDVDVDLDDEDQDDAIDVEQSDADGEEAPDEE